MDGYSYWSRNILTRAHHDPRRARLELDAAGAVADDIDAQRHAVPGRCRIRTEHSVVSLAAMLVRTSDVRYRGRVMGVRAQATCSLSIGLLLLGWMIVPLGFATTAALSAAAALATTLVIALTLRRAIWPLDAPADQL